MERWRIQLVTIKDIANDCGVSSMTVSRVLNGSHLVAEDTKKMVLEACENLGYIPNSAAKALITKETKIIGLIIPAIDHYYTDVIKAITLCLDERDYGLLLCNYDRKREKEKDYMNYLLQGRVDGIILFPSSRSKLNYIKIVDKIPVIFANRRFLGLNASFVGIDNYAGSVKMVDYMIDQGYKRIGVIHPSLNHKSFKDRLQGYKDVLEQNGIAYDESIVCEAELFFDNGYKCAEELVAKGVDSIFAFNDVCAMGVIRYCSDNELSVPGDIGVAGFDNIRYLEMFNHRLTTIDQNVTMIGENLASIILDEINNPSLSKRSLILSPTLVAGRTI